MHSRRYQERTRVAVVILEVIRAGDWLAQAISTTAQEAETKACICFAKMKDWIEAAKRYTPGH